MPQEVQPLTTPDLGTLFFLGIVSFFILAIGWKRHFFILEKPSLHETSHVRWFHPVLGFVLYFVTSTVTLVICEKIIKGALSTPLFHLSFISWLNFCNGGAVFLILYLFFRLLNPQTRQEIWCFGSWSYKQDLQTAFFAYILAFPLVLFVNHFLDFWVVTIFHVSEVPDQLAVSFLKMTFQHPLYFLLALCSVVFFAPTVEELLFRGFLQSFIRGHLGSKQAIVITSLLFAFFHYSHEQGLANITIIGSLFTLSLFIGLVYEKRRSLAAPITFHAIFNAVSVANLYFLGGIPKGSL